MREAYQINIYREPAGKISKDECYTAVESNYLYIADTLSELLKIISEEWQDDKHLAGY